MKDFADLVTPIYEWDDHKFTKQAGRPFWTMRHHIGDALWPRLSQELQAQPCTVCFSAMLEHFEITDERYIRVMYDHFHGQGEFDRLSAECEASHKRAVFEEGFAKGQEIFATGEVGIITYGGAFPDEFARGLEASLEAHIAGKGH